MALPRNGFLVKILLIQPLKSPNFSLPNLKYQFKNKYPPLAKNFTKGYHLVITHVLYNFFDTSLITACAIFCSLKFHVFCTCTFFRCMVDSYIVLTYDCWHCFLVFNIWVSHALETTINFLLSNPWIVLFFIYPTLKFTQNFVHPTILSSVPPPTINNDRSLNVNDFNSKRTCQEVFQLWKDVLIHLNYKLY